MDRGRRVRAGDRHTRRSALPERRALPSLGRGIGHALAGWWWPTNPWTAAYRQERGAPVEGRCGWLSGSALLVRREAFEAVGGFDPQYFMYFEDVDLCDRLARAGWSSIYVPSAVVEHTGGHATRREPDAHAACASCERVSLPGRSLSGSAVGAGPARAARRTVRPLPTSRGSRCARPRAPRRLARQTCWTRLPDRLAGGRTLIHMGRVLLARPRGYCAGVDRAVQTVERAIETYGAPIYVRRQIVHNLHVVRRLEALGAIFVQENDEVPEGAIVVFSAHGVAPTVHESGGAPRVAHHRRDLPARHQGAPRGATVRRRRLRHRADRPRRPRGGRRHHRSGSRPHPPGRQHRRGGHRAGPRSGAGRLPVADHAFGRRDHRDGRSAARALSRAARACRATTSATPPRTGSPR